jgi:hypothetical protein
LHDGRRGDVGGVFGEVPLGIEGRHTTETGGGDRLAVAMVVGVPRPEDPLDVRPGALVADEVALTVEVELAAERLGRGRWPMARKSPPNGRVL